MIPAQEFPLLVIAGAFALDLVRSRARTWSDWKLAVVGGVVFLGAFLAVQWPFANFLISPASGNWIFGTHYVPYFVPPDTDYARGVFSLIERTSMQFWFGMATAFVASILSTRAGLAWGNWMQRVQR
jgi:hypothetical protein